MTTPLFAHFWPAAPPWAQWATVDAYNVLAYHEREPARTGDGWAGGGRMQSVCEVLLMGADWRQAKERRPA